jgi:hypothetical protein
MMVTNNAIGFASARLMFSVFNNPSITPASTLKALLAARITSADFKSRIEFNRVTSDGVFDNAGLELVGSDNPDDNLSIAGISGSINIFTASPSALGSPIGSVEPFCDETVNCGALSEGV